MAFLSEHENNLGLKSYVPILVCLKVIMNIAIVLTGISVAWSYKCLLCSCIESNISISNFTFNLFVFQIDDGHLFPADNIQNQQYQILVFSKNTTEYPQIKQ